MAFIATYSLLPLDQWSSLGQKTLKTTLLRGNGEPLTQWRCGAGAVDFPQRSAAPQSRLEQSLSIKCSCKRLAVKDKLLHYFWLLPSPQALPFPSCWGQSEIVCWNAVCNRYAFNNHCQSDSVLHALVDISISGGPSLLPPVSIGNGLTGRSPSVLAKQEFRKPQKSYPNSTQMNETLQLFPPSHNLRDPSIILRVNPRLAGKFDNLENTLHSDARFQRFPRY